MDYWILLKGTTHKSTLFCIAFCTQLWVQTHIGQSKAVDTYVFTTFKSQRTYYFHKVHTVFQSLWAREGPQNWIEFNCQWKDFEVAWCSGASTATLKPTWLKAHFTLNPQPYVTLHLSYRWTVNCLWLVTCCNLLRSCTVSRRYREGTSPDSGFTGSWKSFQTC